MPHTTRTLFERLTWDGAPVSQPLSTPRDRDAEAALVALGGYKCVHCARPLSAAKGYACCERAHCPFCGTGLEINYVTTCRHYAFCQADYVGCQLFTAYAERHGRGGQVAEEWSQLIYQTPPARRLPDQKGSGYFHWSDEQIALAYAPDVAPHVRTIFRPHLRTLHQDRLCAVLIPLARPDVKTSVREKGHYAYRYFCADPSRALDRVVPFLTALREGTQRLRAMPPAATVRSSNIRKISAASGQEHSSE